MTTKGAGYFDLSSLSVHVIAGQSYAFRVTNASVRDFRIGTSANVYGGGTATVNDSPFTGDIAFKILVEP